MLEWYLWRNWARNYKDIEQFSQFEPDFCTDFRHECHAYHPINQKAIKRLSRWFGVWDLGFGGPGSKTIKKTFKSAPTQPFKSLSDLIQTKNWKVQASQDNNGLVFDKFAQSPSPNSSKSRLGAGYGGPGVWGPENWKSLTKSVRKVLGSQGICNVFCVDAHHGPDFYQ